MFKVMTYVITAYLGAGFFGGLVMSVAVPAMNWFGITVYAMIWPHFLWCAPTTRNCNPLEAFSPWLQSMMFTF